MTGLVRLAGILVAQTSESGRGRTLASPRVGAQPDPARMATSSDRLPGGDRAEAPYVEALQPLVASRVVRSIHRPVVLAEKIALSYAAIRFAAHPGSLGTTVLCWADA